MRIEVPTEGTRLGSLKIYRTQKVYQLDSGVAEEQDLRGRTVGTSNEVLEEIGGGGRCLLSCRCVTRA